MTDLYIRKFTALDYYCQGGCVEDRDERIFNDETACSICGGFYTDEMVEDCISHEQYASEALLA